jgi:hypothetical protein
MRVSQHSLKVSCVSTQVALLLLASLQHANALDLPVSGLQLTKGSVQDASDLHRLQAAVRLQHDFQRLGVTLRDDCAPTAEIPVTGHNLTADELALLPQICWQSHLVPPVPEELPPVPQSNDQRDLPPGVDCEPVQWCADGTDFQHPASASQELRVTCSHSMLMAIPAHGSQ